MNHQFKRLLFIIITILCSNSTPLFALAKPEVTYRIFQFPQNQIPRIDGNFSDWKMVPNSYSIGIDQLENTKLGQGEPQNPKDFDLNVKVGWVKDLNRLYFYIDAFDDFWDFSDPALRQDIFELCVDADLSGGPFIYKVNGNVNKIPLSELYFKGHGAHAQNYHIFTPVKDKDWAMPWGNTPWIKEFPYANVSYHYDFKSGESGRLQMEFYITPFDYASVDGPEHSVISSLKENDIIGMSWSMLDFDGEKCESFMNLSHNLKMINDATYLCAFQLMPLEKSFIKKIDANWKCVTENRDQRIIRFYDHSIGKIKKYHWDFGDGTTSEEKNPVHQYNQGKEWVVILTVEGPAGKSVRSKVWEVVTK